MATRALVVLVCLLAAPSALVGQCLTKANNAKDPTLDYGARQGGVYCDGRVDANHSGRLKLISFACRSKAPVEVPPLTISVSPPAQGGEMVIAGEPLDAELNYRFDAKVTSAAAIRLGPDAALWQLKLHPDDIGWVGSMQAAGAAPIYRPVKVGDGAGACALVFRSGVYGTTLQAVVHGVGGQPTTDLKPLDAPAGKPISWSLPSGLHGTVTVDVTIDGADGISREGQSLVLQLGQP
jgi:hypothetical protein